MPRAFLAGAERGPNDDTKVEEEEHEPTPAIRMIASWPALRLVFLSPGELAVASIGFLETFIISTWRKRLVRA